MAVPWMRARRGVRTMSRQIHRADIAVTSSGDILLNVVALDAPLRLEGLISEARRQRGAVFVGVVLGPREVRRLIDEMGPVLPNVTTRIAGPRIWRRRRASK
jgi:hypothetical protein